MAEDWSTSEVEATVADYFDMLEQELRGRDYNKSAHRRTLAAWLKARSDGAIERKHQNISAILVELGFVYISGYKPLRNYQQLLFDVVSARLDRSQTVEELVRAQVMEPAVIPTVDDILAALVEPPRLDRDDARYGSLVVRERPAVRRGVDYLAIEANNRSLGAAGEEFVVRFETARLDRAGAGRLAAKVERVSVTRGDGLGFDVLSYETTGEERLIEVKTTAYGPATPFFVTRNEIDVSNDAGQRFHLYRPFSFRRHPKLFSQQGPIGRAFSLEPSQFKATPI